MLSLAMLAQSPNALAEDYSHAAVGARIMLTGHVHQAIPDVAQRGYAEHWDCLNKYGEERGDQVFERAWRVREGFAGRIDSAADSIALAASVHELFVRFLSVLPWSRRPRIITVASEHPSLLRQLSCLAEAGIEVIAVPGEPAVDIVERISVLIDDNTAAVCLGSVNRQTGLLVPGLDALLPVCQKWGAELFVDAYQSVNVLPFSLRGDNLEQAFVAGGGAKYCQMGNGNCFMHVPPGRDFRPLVSGWFGSFDAVRDDSAARPLAYGEGAKRFDGSTYDALPHFRAGHVFDYFERRGLTPAFLHDINRHQLALLAKTFHACDFNRTVIQLTADVEYMGAFLALSSPVAAELCARLRDIGVHTDYCGQWLRLGPAPYLSDEQLTDAMIALQEVVEDCGAR
ncbi:kynureninase [Exilibacterium tricleocarpae]|uniref:Kynureninase n=1 Tax=Exilibacterium tricleocarpae TaxID=2591008 RepID=A0A545TQJ6_9GAMM|nr:aminotransferase class V-fold PLP-dependent enzyme [Exilibacterium tricleocarpae]TQV79496.1 kynureninase [Exilibacterium tricleocarpae]